MQRNKEYVSKSFIKLRAMVFIVIAVIVAGCGGVDKNGPHQYNVAIVSNMILPMGIPNVDIKKTDLQITWTLLEGVNASGDVLVEVKIDSLKASMDSISIQCSYDSALADEGLADNDQKAGRVEKYMKVMRGVVGSRYTAQVNLDTKAVEIIKMDERLKVVGQGGHGAQGNNSMFGYDQIKMCLKGSILDTYARLGVYGLGDQVSTEASFTTPFGVTMPNANQYQLAKTHNNPVTATMPAIKDDPTTPFDIVKYSIVLGDAQPITVVNGKKGARSGPIDIKEITGEGELRINKAKKHLVYSLVNTRATLGSKLPKPKKRKDGKEPKMWYIIRCEIEHVN